MRWNHLKPFFEKKNKPMSLMANPMETLLKLQQQLDNGMPIDPATLEPGYVKFQDVIRGKQRYSYVKIVGTEAQALAIFAEEEPFNGVVRLSVGYAVSENHRRRGLAVEAIQMGISDLKKKFGQAKTERFYVEALIDVTNAPSINVAKKVFPGPGTPSTDEYTKTPALVFYQLIRC